MSDYEDKLDALLALHTAQLTESLVAKALADMTPTERKAFNRRLLERCEKAGVDALWPTVWARVFEPLKADVTKAADAWMDKNREAYVARIVAHLPANIDKHLDAVVASLVPERLRALVRETLKGLGVRT